MGAERPKQFLLNLYLCGLQKEIARQVAISQPVTLSSAIQWAEHVDMATCTYRGTSPSKKRSSSGGGGNSGNRGGRGGRSSSWRGGNKGGHGDGGQSIGPPKKPPNSTFNQRKAQGTTCQICKRPGHIVAMCWFRFVQSSTSNSSGRG